MKYALNLGEDGRVLSAAFTNKFTLADGVIVKDLPGGQITEYRYVDGGYIHDPLPAPERPEPEPTAEEILSVLLGVRE